MKGFLKVTAAAALLALAMAPGRALASGSGTATLPVSASVTSGCLVGTVGINFGAVSPLLVEEDLSTLGSAAEAYTAAGAIEIACGTYGPTSGSTIQVALDTGANGAIAPILGIGTQATATRAMTNGTSFLAYDLSEINPTSQATVTGASTFSISATQYNTAILADPGSPAEVVTILGSIPSDQVQPLTPGIYVDTVNVSVSF